MDYSTIATLPNLQPGQNSSDVRKLQQWLIQNGYNIPDGATGFYGPQTTAAVANWQKNSGIDTAGNPGYFGPRSKAYIQTQGTGGSSSSGQPTTANLDALHFLGFTDDQIKAMSPSDRSNFSLTGDYLKKQADLGNIQSQNNAASLQKAYTSALNDPDIASKYSDIQKFDTKGFMNNLEALQTTTDVNSANQKLEFQKQQKDLAEQAAAAGQAYSGFRGQAKQQLDTQQSGIVRSTMANLKQGLQSTLAPLESYYGSDAFRNLLPNTSISYQNPLGGGTSINYDPIGGLTGTQPGQKKADVANRQSQIYQNIASPI